MEAHSGMLLIMLAYLLVDSVCMQLLQKQIHLCTGLEKVELICFLHDGQSWNSKRAQLTMMQIQQEAGA
jgi:hypothetical protein